MMGSRFAWTRWLGLVVALPALATLCGCNDTGNGSGDGAIVIPTDCCPGQDRDEDGICDLDDGRGDPDRDRVPSFEDLDSDGDGLTDREESGRASNCVPPVDSNGDEIPDFLDPDYPGVDAGVPMDAGPPDAAVNPDLCADTDVVDDGCMDPVNEGATSLCNGGDDDCDGTIDENCPCTPGSIQHCFAGPPGRRGVGVCADGVQRCEDLGEFGGPAWGECFRSIEPSPEACDFVDNDCNGCADEIVGCEPPGRCPGPDDERVPEGRPFSSYELRGRDFYTADDAVAWHWSVRGTPCDEMFQEISGGAATAENGQLSHVLRGASSEDASLQFTLSGDYEVTLRVERRGAPDFECTWIVPVRAPGLRVEACWDATGPASGMTGGTLDLDLHLGRFGTTPRWFTPNDCYFATCTAGDTAPLWYYSDTPLENCSGPGATGGFDTSCPNPRLDIDNISRRDAYVPENINVDNPRDGDRFRIMLDHFTGGDRTARPLVTVYCGGEIVGFFGGLGDATAVPLTEGRMWKVADVTVAVDATGATTCTLQPINPPLSTSGAYVVADDNHSF